MDFENSFSVKAPIADVWAALIDVERAAPCMPGAKVVERISDDEFVVGMRVKVGPISMEYKGNVKIVEKDPTAYRAVMAGSGKEVRGQGAAEATAEMVLVERNGETVATIKSDVKLSGRAAAMGQGVIVDVTKRMVDAFSANLAALLTTPEPAAATPAAAESTPGDAATTPPRTAPTPRSVAPAQEAALPILSMVGPVLLSRLRSPRVAIPVGVGIALIAFVVWRARR